MAEVIPPFFPHKRIREGQDELIRDLQTAFSTQHILLAHAPTGLGKTASALSVAVNIALEKKKRIFFLTNRHTQHQIAVETLKQMRKQTERTNPAQASLITTADLIGKRWMCSQEVAGLFGNEFGEFCKAVVEKGECEFFTNVRNGKGKELTVEGKVMLSHLKQQRPLHNEELMVLAKDKRMCSYEIALDLAKDALVIIGDYYYIFNPHVSDALFTKLNLKLEDCIVIVDEGHNLPTRVTDMLSSNLTTSMLRNASQEAQRFGYKGIILWLHDLNAILTKLAGFSEREREKSVPKEEFMNAIKKIVSYDELINQVDIAADEIRKKQRRSYLGGISSFLKSWKGEDEGYARILSERQGMHGPIITLSYSCLDPSIITRDIFTQVHGAVLMSGTLQPTFMFKDILGIEKSMEREYASPFPVENKLSLIIPQTSTKYSLRGEAMYQKIADVCSELATLIPGNVAFFFPSYDLRDRIGHYINSQKKKFWEKAEMSKEEKEAFLAGFKGEKEQGGVLLGVAGANFAEGIDLPGDLLNGVVVVGLPLARPDLKTRELISYYDTKFGKGWDYGYVYPAMAKCVQSSGRCIRSETDKGTVIFLDERFSWQQYYCCLPREGLMVTMEYGERIKKFFWESVKTMDTRSPIPHRQ